MDAHLGGGVGGAIKHEKGSLPRFSDNPKYPPPLKRIWLKPNDLLAFGFPTTMGRKGRNVPAKIFLKLLITKM
jgi:hypothetical protein